MKDFIELRILGAVRGLLVGRVNEILREMEIAVPVVEFGDYFGGGVVVPGIALSSYERSEKERIIRLDVYALTISFDFPETPDSELHCYAYASSVCKAVGKDPTLGGVAERAVVTGKKYMSPKKLYSGEGWRAVINLRVTVEIEL